MRSVLERQFAKAGCRRGVCRLVGCRIVVAAACTVLPAVRVMHVMPGIMLPESME